MTRSKGQFAYLKDRAREPEAEEAAASSGSLAKPAVDESGSVPQYGRRADPAYAQIAASIPAELRKQWRVKLAQEEREQQDVLELLMRAYVEGRVKV